MNAPRFTKAHSHIQAQKLIELGWTIRSEFKDKDGEIYEWLLVWDRGAEPEYAPDFEYKKSDIGCDDLQR